jgi:hypothetical protein
MGHGVWESMFQIKTAVWSRLQSRICWWNKINMHAICATFILLSSNSAGLVWNGIDLIKTSVYAITLLLRTWVRLSKEITKSFRDHFRDLLTQS